jgi:hypothetical protein
MKVYTLSHCTNYEGDTLLGIYQYLSQAQEAEYAYMLQADTRVQMWTEIREVTMGAAPLVDEYKLGVEVK